jgi:glycosyltransferase involved in cell wall biosynthesis
MKIFFVTIDDARDIKNWSGIPFYLAKTFVEAGIEVEFIGNLKSLPANYFQFRIRNLLYNRLLKKKFGNYISFYEPKNLQFIASQVNERISNRQDAIIFSPGTLPIAYLDTPNHIAVWTDATFAIMENYYEDFRCMSKRTIKNCHLYEKNALDRSSLAVYSSKWAANSSLQDYGVDPAKVKIIPFGGNLEVTRTVDDIIENNCEKSTSICKLLFIGQNWDRKGGEAAVNIAKYLNENDIKTELTIVGCTPPDNLILPDYIRVLGFIDKSVKEGENLISKLYLGSHFFILPTVAECTPVVFSEANSFGLPVITTNTGGISSVIKNDVNGRMFENPIDIPSCARYIGQVFSDYNHYKELSLTSFNEFLTNLNWRTSIKKLISYLNKLEQVI